MLLGKDFVMQGGVRNYLGETEEVNNAPRYWQSSPTSPKTELSYITDKEKNLLLDANLHGSLKGGKPNKGAAGLLSFDGWGDASDGFGGGGDTSPGATGGEGGESGGTTTSSFSGGGAGGYTDRIQRVSSGVEPGYTPTSSQPFGVSPEQAYQEGRITVDQYREAQQVQDNAALNQPNLLEKAFDLYKQYSPLGIAFNLGGGLLDKIGGASKSLQDKAMTFSLNKRLSNIYEDNPDFEDYESVSEIPGEIGSKVQDLELDLQGIRDGNFTQTDFTEKYGSGVATNFSSERDAMNQLTPYAPYAISGQTPQDSMVNQYFANQPTSSLSSGLETSYNNAKSNINNILGIATPSQQFGYSQAPYGSYSSTNMADNPYKDYLTTRGLI
ncbi:MAG: hypothetical protein ACKVHI_08655 [Candidatus Puniceispirillales bacterium]